MKIAIAAALQSASVTRLTLKMRDGMNQYGLVTHAPVAINQNKINDRFSEHIGC
jgi:hypothetical protein